MFHTRVLALFLAMVVAAVCSGQSNVQTWASAATWLPQPWDADTEPVTVRAPSGKLSLRVISKKTRRLYLDDEVVQDYFVEKDGRRLRPSIHPYATPSALWSPDSDLLAIMSSNGGLVGNWTVYVYSVSGNRLIKHNVMGAVQRDLALHFPAGINPRGTAFFSEKERKKFANDTSWVNVNAVGWLTNPERLLVVAGVPGSSSYGENMGKQRGYIVAPRPGRILRSYTEEQFRRTWPSLNEE